MVLDHYGTAKYLRALVMAMWNGDGYTVGLSRLATMDTAHFEAAIAMMRQYHKYGENDREFMALADDILKRMDEEQAAEENGRLVAN
jgi:hypothetical protein